MDSAQVFGFEFERQWDYENGFHLTSHPTRLAKIIAHYELYKSIVYLPGHVIECGVYKGASLIRFATFREMLENPFSRVIIGFDSFGAFPQQTSPQDRAFIERHEREGGLGIPLEMLRKALAVKNLANIELIPGDLVETLPRYLAERPEFKIALLHIDVDVYLPTVVTMQLLYDRVVRGGLVVLDDYGTVAGETRAIDEFLANRDLRVEKLPLSHIPAYIRKP